MSDRYVVLRSPTRGSTTRGGLEDLGGATTSDIDEDAEVLVETEDVDTKSEVEDLANDPEVLAVTPTMPMTLHEPAARDVDAAADTDLTWGVAAVGAHSSAFDGSGVTVAVLDTGIDADHAAFVGVNVVQKDFTGEGDGDDNGHGTHCAGTIFGQDVDGLRIGVARGIDKALIGKVLGRRGGGSTEGIAAAIQWALEEGANVISMSLGMDFPGMVKRLADRGFPVDLATSKALEAYRGNIDLFTALADLARARGAMFGNATLLIAAAGNESKRGADPDHEIAVAPPATARGFVSVGALGQTPAGLTVADFSNTRPRVSGPGVGIRSAKTGGGLTAMNGTSMATPHVAGVSALWASKMLAEEGRIAASAFEAKLVGSGRTDGLADGFDPADIGTGLVLAPQ